jgi:hypothetical protein
MDRRLAVLRIVLGLGQVVGVTAALCSLIQTGMSGLTVVATLVTLLPAVVSKLLFGRKKRHA